MKKLILLLSIFMLLVTVNAQTQKSIKLYEKGNEFYNLKEYNEAIKFYDKAIKISPDYSKPYLARGFAFTSLEKYDLAMSNFNTVIELEPDSLNLNVYYIRGNINEGFTKNKDAALKDYVKAGELNPKLSVIFYRISILKFELNDFIGANQAIEKALKIEKEPAYLKLEKKIKIKLGITFEVVIGTQAWMTENLNVDKFRNGEIIPQAKTDEDWEIASILKKPVWCYYDNDTSKGEEYGKLYNWYAVNDPRGLAPKGWHIPSHDEWVKLRDHLGGADVAGKKMKSNSGWYGNRMADGNGNNESGFSGLPGGCRNGNGFRTIGSDGNWWSTTEGVYKDDAFIRSLSDYDNFFTGNKAGKGAGLSVRCLRD